MESIDPRLAPILVKEMAMIRFVAVATTALALTAAALSASLAQPADQPQVGMMGGGCPMMDMMGRGMMGQGTMGPGMGMGMGQGPGRGMMMGGPATMGAMIDGRLAYLKAELGITAEQTAAWDGYAAAVKARVGTMQEMHRGMVTAMQSGTAPARMDARIKGMEAMVEAMKAVKPAMEKLYAALTDEQKKAADQLIGMDCGAM